MFINHDVLARRVARIGFGGVLCAGAVLLVARDWLWPDRDAAASIMIGTWVVAFATYHTLARRPVRTAPKFASVAVPTIGICFMLPLLIYLPLAVLVSDGHGYDEWVSLSERIAGPTMLITAILSSMRAWDLAQGRRPLLPLSPLAIYLIGIASACSFVMFSLPILVAITGVPFISLLHYQATLIGRERLLLARPVIPRAVARA